MIQDSQKFERLREDMVKYQIEARGITDAGVLNAMRKVPRHYFVSDSQADHAYGDFPLPIAEEQTISQPFIVAEMTQALALTKNDRVLEIGTGSGYQAAILAEIADRVYTIERIFPLYQKSSLLFETLGYQNIVTRYSDGTIPWSGENPFDAIIVTAGSPQIPDALVEQLAVGGRMVIPVGNQISQELVKLYKDRHGLHQSVLGACRFVKLIGEQGWKD